MNVLTFHLAGTPYALPLEAVAEVLAAPPVRRVPSGPPGVLGLAEAGGCVVAVLDLGYLLDERTAIAPRHLVRLASPHERSALAVGGEVRTGTAAVPGHDTGQDASGRVLVGGVPHVLLDPARLLSRAAGA